MVRSDFFAAEARALGLANGGHAASLTWHCLAMAELLAGPPAIIMVEERCTGEDDKMAGFVSTTDNNAALMPGHDRIMCTQAEPRMWKEEQALRVAELQKRLGEAEMAVAEANRTVECKEAMIADLKAKLEQSAATCRSLLDTVKEQEEALDKLC